MRILLEITGENLREGMEIITDEAASLPAGGRAMRMRMPR